MERATKNEVCTQLSEVQSQLRQSEEARQADKAQIRQLRERMGERERELVRVREEGRKAEESGRDRETELRAHLQALETDSREQVSLL